ncbi:MAG: pirin family protein [Cytophagales bacterium]|nr:MAG: pirin family protein [Cytophagales bacterium]
MENIVIHKANTRGKSDLGWLKANFTFSFANYHNPERMNFGVLRVMNDDIIAAGKGFGTHPHDNMEIITIPLEGALEHKDSMGNGTVIRYGDIQCMSAGTGIQHSEFNPDKNKIANTLQIWMFPNKRNVTPRYDQKTLNKDKAINNLQQILSPNKEDEGVWVHQDAWFLQGIFEKDFIIDYFLKRKGNGVYVFVIQGDATINGHALKKRDGFGIWNIEKITILSNSSNTEILVMDVPMSLS